MNSDYNSRDIRYNISRKCNAKGDTNESQQIKILPGSPVS